MAAAADTDDVVDKAAAAGADDVVDKAAAAGADDEIDSTCSTPVRFLVLLPLLLNIDHIVSQGTA